MPLSPRVATLLVPLALTLLAGCPGAAGGGSPCAALPGCEASGICCDSKRVCEERVCQGVGYICSVDSTGSFAWVDRAAHCDDGNPCTVDDLCVGGRCQGLPMACDSPPPSRCTGDQTLESYKSPGTCVQGQCDYTTEQVTCGDACQNGACTGEPCKGVSCTSPPSSCYVSPGRCVEGSCQYDKRPAGTSCTPQDPCVIDPQCDAQGVCGGDVKSCKAPHASGASCVPGTGECQGYRCDSGYRDCNNDMDKDGCETKVSESATHCGDCNKPCSGGSHGKASCVAGTCKLTCDSGWGDCDGDPSNGCERRLGPATCDTNGTNTSGGCGHAYCGTGSTSASNKKVKNFGSWYCVFCEHCRKNSNGSYSWCLKSSGQYASGSCFDCCNDGLTDPQCAP